MIGDLVSKLIASGTPPELAAVVVAEAFAVGAMSVGHVTSRDESVTHRRESDRLRKQRSRDRLVTDRDVTGQSQPPLSKRESLEEREAVSAVSRDETWMPSDEDWRDAVAKLGLQVADSEMAKFREINRRTGAKRDSDWRVWVQRAVDWQAKNKPPPQAPTKTDAAFDWDSVMKTYRRTGFWSPQAGPDPESPACRCPPDILEKHGIIAMRATA